MNTRMRNLKKYFMSLGDNTIYYTWYINENNTVSTEFYFGTSPKTKVPEVINNTNVTVLGSTTYCNNNKVAEVEIPITVTEIE